MPLRVRHVSAANREITGRLVFGSGRAGQCLTGIRRAWNSEQLSDLGNSRPARDEVLSRYAVNRCRAWPSLLAGPEVGRVGSGSGSCLGLGR